MCVEMLYRVGKRIISACNLHPYLRLLVKNVQTNYAKDLQNSNCLLHKLYTLETLILIVVYITRKVRKLSFHYKIFKTNNLTFLSYFFVLFLDMLQRNGSGSLKYTRMEATSGIKRLLKKLL
jgi:hypothetical protein